MRTWPTETTELAPGVFAYVQATGGFCIANAGIIDGGAEGATAVDALFTPDMTRALLAENQRLTAKPLVRLVNTHHHVDHTLGNALFPRETEIVAHAKAKAEMARTGIGVLDIIKQLAPQFETQLDGAAERLPGVTFDGDALELRIGERRVRLLHFGTGHTRGDVLVHLRDERILFTGDLAFFYVTPLAHEGHIGNWISIANEVLAMDGVGTIVPGHGPVGGKDDLRVMARYFELVRDGARSAFDAGASRGDAVRSIDLGEYAEWGEAERIVPNVARLYQEFRGELEGLL